MKGQMEIIGLMMITVMAGVVIALALNASMNKSTDLMHETFGESILSKRFVSVLSTTTVEECGVEYRTLVKDCAVNGGLTCNGESSCDVAHDTAEEILSTTLDGWGVSYNFKVENADDIGEINNLDCGPSDEKEAPGRHPVPLYPSEGEAVIVLEICKT